MNFGQLKEELRSILGRDVVSTAHLLARDSLNKTLRTLWQERHVDVNVTAGVIDVQPSDIEEIQSICIGPTTYHPLSLEAFNKRDRQNVYCLTNDRNDTAARETGTPRVLLPPDAGGIGEMTYIASLQPLRDNSDENEVSKYNPTALVYVTLYHHAKLIRDDSGVAYWEPIAFGAIEEINRADLRKRYSGGTLRPVAPS